MFKSYIDKKLQKYVKKYFNKHPDVKLVVVAGSVGKTSTKNAIATVLSERYKVRVHEGNHNAELSAPLAILGIEYPKNLRSIGAWLKVFKAARIRIKLPTDVDVIVQELGTDRIGQIPAFGKYLNPDIAVVTAISPEHMEYFGNMENVAKEELSVVNYSKSALINRFDIPGEYAEYIDNPNINTYGSTDIAEYRFDIEDYIQGEGFKGVFVAPEFESPLPVTLGLIGEHSTRTAVASGAVAVKLGLSAEQIVSGMSKIRAMAGRMSLLRGIEGSTLIDDTYNSSPLAVKSALHALYSFNSPQRIAVLGSMNELGESSPAEHAAIGSLCDPMELSHVVTVGEEAAKYLAPEAQKRGCHTVSFKSPLSAGAYVNKFIEEGTVVLFKGSQGGIYLEEAVKMSLHSADDDYRLVRQSDEWMKIKQDFFDTLTPGE